MLSEFDLIAKYFTRPLRDNSRATLGIGDDCALFTPTPGMQLAVSSDMLIEGRHFFPDADPYSLGHKSLAVNLSDLAAMGAQPLAFTLALALPQVDEIWLAAFSKGMFALSDQFQCELIGGDTTRGPLNICITIFGELPPSLALRRNAAQAGDDVWVSGTLGDARLALAGLQNEIFLDARTQEIAAQRLHLPQPRISLGLALRGIAHAAIDISDGLIGDLGHILKNSGVGATLEVDTIPLGAMLAHQPQDVQRRLALAGGDDYELCFTAAIDRRTEILAAAQATDTHVTRIGTIEAKENLRMLDADGAPLHLRLSSFDHFVQ